MCMSFAKGHKHLYQSSYYWPTSKVNPAYWGKINPEIRICISHWGESRSELRFKCFSSSNPESHFLWFDTAFVVILVWIMTFSSIKTTICPPRTPWIVIIGFFTLIGKTSKTRGKSLLELWILVTTFLPDWQQPLIFVRFIWNFLCMDSNSMGSAHAILK